MNDAVEIIKKSGKNLVVGIGRKQPDILQQGTIHKIGAPKKIFSIAS